MDYGVYESGGSGITFWLIIAGTVLFLMIFIGTIIAKLYVRAPKDVSFVRTGMGGQRVIKDGGALKIPIVHDITWVNLRTLRLEVRRAREGAMITFDRMRVDIAVEFYVRVKPDKESIALAAQTLGERTLESQKLSDLVEAKFVDALRGVAAQMTLTDLHEKRQEFVQKVQNAVAGDLEQNGLELESVSLTSLDQTSAEFFNPANAFDAEGLTRLTEVTEKKKKERNEIEQETRIDIEQRNLDADRRAFEINQEKEYVRLETERNVAQYAAETKAQTAAKEAEAKRQEEEAAIQAQLAVQQTQIQSDRDVELERQGKVIAVANKSREESRAEAEADAARAEAVAADEKVTTVAKVAQAERQKQVAIVAAREAAEKDAVEVTVAAEAERRAAEDRAEAVMISARAKGEATKIEAEADAKRYQVEAEGQEAINAARNVLDERIIALELKTALIKVLPEVLEAAMKPVEKIKDIRIIDMGGGRLPALNGGGNGGANGHGGGGGSGGGTLPDNIVSALMAYRMQAPLVDELLEELGFEPKQGLGGMVTRLSSEIEAGKGKGPAGPKRPARPAAKRDETGTPESDESS
ncbi:MAG: SPFH domain-containing protein [Rhodospirillales bacterium]|nr:SPFH domain-containing protein [Rhodospirillales bacterium]